MYNPYINQVGLLQKSKIDFASCPKPLNFHKGSYVFFFVSIK